MYRAEAVFIQNDHLDSIVAMLAFMIVMPMTQVHAQGRSDSSKILDKVLVIAEKKTNPFTSVVPAQSLDRETLQQINAESVGDAAKYFSGVFIKDYGGMGGLKTISVRSLGGLNTGLLYDGITVADAQTGQIDLSKFSATFIQRMDLYQANPPEILQPARAFASTSVLTLFSNTYNPVNFNRVKWQVGLNAGSFGLLQPAAGIYMPVAKNLVLSANAETTWSKGDYPYQLDNGIFSETSKRINADVNAFQGEINLVNRFSDSSQLNVKSWYYGSERGLPGSVIYFNNISVQRLKDNDYFFQGQYRKKFSQFTSVIFSAKYSAYYTRYRDPNFPNGSGGLDDQYWQNETYLSAAISQHIGNYFKISFASDLAFTKLKSDITLFPDPNRLGLWNNVAIQFVNDHWLMSASVLNTNVHDKSNSKGSVDDHNKFTPSVALSYRTSNESPILFRIFYKDIYRMPTFNDLYYVYNPTLVPKLQPEFSNQYSAGFSYSKNTNGKIHQFSLSADAYYNCVKNKIVAVPSQNLFVWTVTNIGRVQIKGIDINATTSGKFNEQSGWSMRIAYTWQQALDITDPNSSLYKNNIPYTPANSGSGLLNLYINNWGLSYNFLFSGLRYALAANDPSNELEGWAQQDLTISKKLIFRNFQTRISAELSNLFNQQYDIVQYYPMPGRAFKLSLLFTNL